MSTSTDLFWISIFGMAFIIGGAVLLKKVGLSDLFVFGYAILSTRRFSDQFRLQLIWRVESLCAVRRTEN